MGVSQKKAQGCLGFTIPELLVSIFIIVLMTGISVIGWSSGETALALDRAAHKLAQDVRKATELAQRAQPLVLPLECVSPGKIKGYGVHVSSGVPTSYIIYAECNDNSAYNSEADTIVQTVALEGKIRIASATTPSSFSVLFVPPVPTITIWSGTGNVDQATITLSVAGDTSRSKTIMITTKGIIDID